MTKTECGPDTAFGAFLTNKFKRIMQNMFFFQSDDFSYKKFTNLMGCIYGAFHAYWSGEEDEFRSLVKQGDSIIRNEVFKPFLNEVANYREDFIISDREVAAFAAAFIIYANA